MSWPQGWYNQRSCFQKILPKPPRSSSTGASSWAVDSKPSPKDPTVTLSSSGIIGLNTAVAKNVIGDARYALLFFDEARQLMGLRFVKHNDPDAYPVKLTASKSHGSLSGTSFLKTHNIFPTETSKYAAIYNEKEKMLSVDLTKPMEARKTNRGKNK